MIQAIKLKMKQWLATSRLFLISRIGKKLLQLLFMTCKVKIEGVEAFIQLAKRKPCIVMLWHNRLSIVPCVLDRHVPHLTFAALVSESRDGKLLQAIVESYPRGKTIKVGHQARFQALRELVHHVQKQEHIVIMTPDGPRGPKYKMKPGIALAALETQAFVVGLNWEANRYWQLNTWDQLRFPKPFSKINITFAIAPPLSAHLSLEEANKILENYLP